MIEPFETDDPHDRRFALGLSGVLARFNAAGVVEASDAHAARRIQALAAERPEVAVVGTSDPARDDPLARDAIEAATGQPAPAADDDERIVATVADALRQRRDAIATSPPASGSRAPAPVARA